MDKTLSLYISEQVAHAVTTWLPLFVLVSIQESQYTYDAILRRFRVAIGAVEER